MKRFFAAVAFTVGLLIATIAAPFDKVPTKVDVLGEGYSQEAALALPTVKTTGTGWGYYPSDKGTLTAGIGIFDMKGSGFVVEGGYIVTAAHVVAPRKVQIRTGPSVYRVVRIFKVETRTVMIEECQPASIVFEDVENDIAVLKFHVATLIWRALPYKPSWTRMWVWIPFGSMQASMLGKGDAVGILAHKRAKDGDFAWGYDVRWGAVRDTGVCLPPGLEHDTPWFGLDDVTLDLEVIPGDSGSPVIAVDQGKIVIVGVARASVPSPTDGFYSFMVRIDSIIPLLEAK